jgi:hypothetical protein
MRSIKLVPALAAIAAAALTLAPTSASAAKGLNGVKRNGAPSGGCRVNVYAAPRFIETGERRSSSAR